MKQLEEPSVGAELKILVVEDSGLSFALTEALIERLTGNNPERAANGVEAVAKAQSGNYDLIVMDLLMPEMNGLEATRQIRTLLPDWKQPYIAGLSGATSNADVTACREAGMDRFLAKPMRLAHLDDLLDLVSAERSAKMSFEAIDSLQMSVA